MWTRSRHSSRRIHMKSNTADREGFLSLLTAQDVYRSVRSTELYYRILFLSASPKVTYNCNFIEGTSRLLFSGLPCLRAQYPYHSSGERSLHRMRELNEITPTNRKGNGSKQADSYSWSSVHAPSWSCVTVQLAPHYRSPLRIISQHVHSSPDVH